MKRMSFQDLARGARGFSLTEFMIGCFGLILLIVLLMKVGPSLMEFMTIEKHLKEVAREIENSRSSERIVGRARESLTKRFNIDNVKTIEAGDITITGTAVDIEMEVEYERCSNLMDRVRLCIDFKASSVRDGAAGGKGN